MFGFDNLDLVDPLLGAVEASLQLADPGLQSVHPVHQCRNVFRSHISRNGVDDRHVLGPHVLGSQLHGCWLEPSVFVVAEHWLHPLGRGRALHRAGGLGGLETESLSAAAEGPHVADKGISSGEFLATPVAAVGLLASVKFLVAVEIINAAELLATGGTFVGFVDGIAVHQLGVVDRVVYDRVVQSGVMNSSVSSCNGH